MGGQNGELCTFPRETDPSLPILLVGALGGEGSKCLTFALFWQRANSLPWHDGSSYGFSGWAWRLKMIGSKGSAGAVGLGEAGCEAAKLVCPSIEDDKGIGDAASPFEFRISNFEFPISCSFFGSTSAGEPGA